MEVQQELGTGLPFAPTKNGYEDIVLVALTYMLELLLQLQAGLPSIVAGAGAAAVPT